MEVVLYTMNKRNKSSARPSGEGLVLNLQLKDECDLEHPEFVFDFEPTNYNYCYIPTWNRYYFKGEQQYFHGRWFVKFDEDYLATWLTDIRNTRAYVMYDNNTYDIVDKRIPTIATPIIDLADGEFRDDLPHPPLAAEGTYIICSVGGDGVQVNATRNANNLKALLTDLDNWINTYVSSHVTDVTTGIGAWIKQMMGTNDVKNNLRSVVFIPLLVDDTLASETLKLGFYDTGKYFPEIPLNDIYVKKTGSVSIPWQVNDWRRNAPYTEVYLYIPFIGLVNYPSSDLVDRSSFEVESVVNIVTGEISVLVKAIGSSDVITMGTYGGNIASNIPVGSAGLNPVNLATQVVKGTIAATAAATGALPTLPALMAGGASMVMEGLEPLSSTIGNLAGGTSNKFSNRLICYTAYRPTIVEPSSVVDIIGSPSMFVKSLANASGFIQTAGFQLGGVATAPEKDAVNALMDSGVYLE